MTSLEGGRLRAGRDVTRAAGRAAVRSPAGRGRAESPVTSRAGRGQSVSAEPNQNKPETRLFPPAPERVPLLAPRTRGCEPRCGAPAAGSRAGRGGGGGMAG
ncbi:unnamed protein product [Pipistrellus nathusii]|uniref:Uncharacterized protein n=1 Tax=Pipistrellus nathusii TaxID=59473 RepID=A0ABP0A7Z7_PIPNA